MLRPTCSRRLLVPVRRRVRLQVLHLAQFMRDVVYALPHQAWVHMHPATAIGDGVLLPAAIAGDSVLLLATVASSGESLLP